jgi:carbon monoxide dehydrogenase subunit G
MKIAGEASVRAAVPRVYAALTDPAVLVRVIPGCQRLEQTGPDTYRATVLAGVAAIKGTFDGEVRLSDRDEPTGFTLHASGAGAPGTVAAVAKVALAAAADGTTLVSYDADATIGGVIGGVGQRMITSVARRTAADFFAAVDRELAGQSVPEERVPAAAVLDSGLEEANLPAPPAPAPAVWTVPGPDAATLLARQRVRDLMIGAAFGAVVALLGVLIGALVAGW